MTPLGPVKRHFWLVQRMARALGVDLGAKVASGRLSAPEHADMVTRCRGCDCADACEARLDRLSRETGLRFSLPEGCENRVLFGALAGHGLD